MTDVTPRPSRNIRFRINLSRLRFQEFLAKLQLRTDRMDPRKLLERGVRAAATKSGSGNVVVNLTKRWLAPLERRTSCGNRAILFCAISRRGKAGGRPVIWV